MDAVVSMVEAKSKLAELVGQVKYGGKRYILERRGQPMAVLINVEEYAQLRAQAAVAARIAPPASSFGGRSTTPAGAPRRSHRWAGRLFSDLPSDDDALWVEIQAIATLDRDWQRVVDVDIYTTLPTPVSQ
jgi:prevent-host-death family protein